MFEFSGDNQWARWSVGVECSGEGCANEAVGVSVDLYHHVRGGSSIQVSPMCETHATVTCDGLIMFNKEDN